MTIHTPIINLIETGADAVELEGLTLAMRILVADYIGDRSLEKCNALDALACAIHGKAKALSLTAGKVERVTDV